MLHAFQSERIVTPAGTRPGALLVEGEHIVAICTEREIPHDAIRHDFRSKAILPGLVDTHVHINEPGRTEWEGFRTATRAAAAGGFTLLVDMPLNCLPETTTVDNLELKRQAAQGQCLVDWAAWGGAVADNQQDLEPLAQAGVPGFKCFLIYPGCDGFTMIDRAQLEAALPHIARTGLPLLVHAELAGPIETAMESLREANWTQYSTYLASRPDDAEFQAIELLIHLCRQYGFRLHIVHLSTAKALPVLAAAKAEGLPITVETCPHYLHFAAEDIPDGATLHKCAPPIRSRANRDLLWQGLADGTIDLIATDHSPCPPAMKRLQEGRWDLSWGGIASLSVALPVVYTDAIPRGHTLDDVARWLSSAPAALAGFSAEAGALLPGREASFIVFDPEATHVPTPETLYFRHPISPYLGKMLKGKVDAAFLRGKRVFEGGSFAEAATGREVRHGACAILKDTVLSDWNTFTPEAATAAILPCCGSQTWADAVAAQRPIPDTATLFTASDRVWASLPNGAWQEAFDSHPRLGEQHAKAATATSLGWSSQEQAKAAPSDALREANAHYEERFGRIFLFCANGRTGPEILAALEARMNNSPEAEWLEAGEQQRQITQLRLKRWLEGH